MIGVFIFWGIVLFEGLYSGSLAIVNFYPGPGAYDGPGARRSERCRHLGLRFGGCRDLHFEAEDHKRVNLLYVAGFHITTKAKG